MNVFFLGQGPFANPIRSALKRHFKLSAIEFADVAIVASWGKILTKKIITRPKYSTLNIHPSLLPKYRGATPIQSAILNGDITSGVTIIKMDEKIDHGPILSQYKIAIANDETYKTLCEKLARLGARMIVELLPQYVSGQVKPRKQHHAQATYVPRFKKEDGELNLNDPAVQNERKVRAFWPWPGAWIEVNEKKLFIHKSHIEDGKFIPDLVQLEGRKIMSLSDFKRGWRGALSI